MDPLWSTKENKQQSRGIMLIKLCTLLTDRPSNTFVEVSEEIHLSVIKDLVLTLSPVKWRVSSGQREIVTLENTRVMQLDDMLSLKPGFKSQNFRNLIVGCYQGFRQCCERSFIRGNNLFIDYLIKALLKVLRFQRWHMVKHATSLSRCKNTCKCNDCGRIHRDKWGHHSW